MARCEVEGSEEDMSLLSNDQEHAEFGEDTGFFSNFTTNYYSNKRVVIKSKWLQVPNLIIQFLVFLCMIFQLCYKLSFMRKEEVVGVVDGSLVKPQQNWDDCDQADLDCISLVGKGPKPEYCTNNQLIGRPFAKAFVLGKLQDRNVSKCWQDDVHVEPGPKIFIPTMVTHMYQRYGRLADDKQSIVEYHEGMEFDEGSWYTDKVTDYYIQNIEHFLVKISHAFISKQHGARSNVDMRGFLVSANDTEFRFADGPNLTQSGRWTWGSDLKTCGGQAGNVSEQPRACVKTAWGDVISVQQLLQHTNVSLDAVRMTNHENNVTYRQSGLAINAHIRYHNTEDFWNRLAFHSEGGLLGFWHNLVDPPPSYTIKFSIRPTGRSFISRTQVRYPFHIGESGTKSMDWTFRTVEIRTGIQVDFSAGGVLEKPSTGELLLSFVEALALMSIATLMVEQFLSRLYLYSSKFKSVGVLFQASKHEESLHEHEFQEFAHLDKEGDTDDAPARARVFQQTHLFRKYNGELQSPESPLHSLQLRQSSSA